MKEFKGKVAVITGASHGIGFGIAERCAREGMQVVLAGINEDNLKIAEEKLKPTGATLLSVRVDVSKREQVEVLAQQVFGRFGAVHLLVNNAGVAAGSSPWESSWEDWEWVMNVNFWGVLNGIKIFTPLMLAQEEESHIVNVASVAGFLSSHPNAPYMVTKHAVIALSENLYHSLKERTAKVKVSVLCPGWVRTAIMQSERNRPKEFQSSRTRPRREDIHALREMKAAVEAGMPVEELVEHLFQALRSDQFYVLTHPEVMGEIKTRLDHVLQQTNP